LPWLDPCSSALVRGFFFLPFCGPMSDPVPVAEVLRLRDIGFEAPRALLEGHGLTLVQVADGEAIPGSYWGECEAGLIGTTVYARADTPVHSLLHEACHLLVMPPERRAVVHTDATDSVAEEDATCYLQILLMADMDAWGYTFRLGSAKAWFEQDAELTRQMVARIGFGSAEHRRQDDDEVDRRVHRGADDERSEPDPRPA
jgi:hypothetical protein